MAEEQRGSPSHLSAQSFVRLGMGLGSVQCLLEKGEQHRDYDDGFQRLSKDDEENGHGKDVLGHVEAILARRENSLLSLRGEDGTEDETLLLAKCAGDYGLLVHVATDGRLG